MNKKSIKKFWAVSASCFMLLASSVPVSAAAEAMNTAGGEAGIEPYMYIEPCWKCNGGHIYSSTVSISRCLDKTELCKHGYTKGTDNYYTVSFAYVYSCIF